ncbi:MAG: hypothetical protein JNK05_30800 [Myxococcales bacterium]|nr:hypothetical protein [Myxococcales bacterium]
MHSTLETLAARVRVEYVDRGTTARDRLGGDCFIRIELERYLRATFVWLLPLAGLEPKSQQKLEKDPPAKLGAGKLAHYIANPLCNDRTRQLSEVALLFPALAKNQIIDVVIDVLSDVMHGRPAHVSTDDLRKLLALCSRLLQQFAPRSWVLAPGQVVDDAVVVAPVRRVGGVEEYRVRRADDSRTTLLVGASGTAERAIDAPSGTQPITPQTESSGVIGDRRWVRCRDELACSFADVIAEQQPGKTTSQWAAATIVALLEPMLRSGAPQSLDSNAIVFARSNAALDRPMLLPQALFAQDARARASVDPLGTTALLSLAATGAIQSPSSWASSGVDPTLTRWAQQLSQSALTLDALRTTHATMQAQAGPRPALRSALFGDAVATDSRARRARTLIAVGVGIGLVGAGVVVGASVTKPSEERARSARRDTESPTVPRTARTLSAETPEQVLDRWDEGVRSGGPAALADTYVDGAYVHGFLSRRDTDERARGAWAERTRQGGWFRRGPRRRTAESQRDLRGYARASCRDEANPAAPVLRFVADAEWLNPITHSAVPCQTIRGPYFWRMKQTPAGWRICHESWEMQSAICASCPHAPACGGTGVAE